MLKNIHVDCPTYLDIKFEDGHVNSVNGKELNDDGVKEVISFLCQEVNVKTEDVLQKISSLNTQNGDITLKLFNGAVHAV